MAPKLVPALAALAVLSSCEALRGSERTSVTTAQTVASAHWFRGVPLSQGAVTQGDLTVNTPLSTGGVLSFTTWYNAELTNDPGEARFAEGQGGEASEIDLVFHYSHPVGPVNLSIGGVGYHFPELLPSTREAYLGATVQLFGIAHSLTAYYDIDLLEDVYLSYQASRGFTLDEHWSAALAVLLGYMGDDQAAFWFGEEHSGFSDVLLTGTLSYRFDANTSVFLRGASVTVPDDELAQALDDSGEDDSGLWLALGAAWGL